MAYRALRTQRIEKAVLTLLEDYDGIPLTCDDVADELGRSQSWTNRLLRRLEARYLIQGAYRDLPRQGRPVRHYWVGMPNLLEAEL